jgi:hypothetical protein
MFLYIFVSTSRQSQSSAKSESECIFRTLFEKSEFGFETEAQELNIGELSILFDHLSS